MNRFVMYLRMGLATLWFFFAIFVSLLLLPFRWKDPSVGALAGRIVSWGGTRIMGWTLKIENRRALYTSQPCVYVGNHQSNMDLLTIGGAFPKNTVVIGKSQLKWVPLFGLFFTGTGMIMIDRADLRSSVESLEKAKDALLKDGRSIMIFCEGTRNGGFGLLPFKKGAFHMAISAQVPLVPIVTQHLHSYFDLKRGRITPSEVLIRVLDPVPTKGMSVDDLPRLMADVRGRIAGELAKPEMKHPRDIAILRDGGPAPVKSS